MLHGADESQAGISHIRQMQAMIWISGSTGRFSVRYEPVRKCKPSLDDSDQSCKRGRHACR